LQVKNAKRDSKSLNALYLWREKWECQRRTVGDDTGN